MTDVVTYRTDDATRWGTGKGSDLTPREVDLNFWVVLSELAATIAHISSGAVGIDYITLVPPDQMVIHLTDHTTQGPFTIPTAQWNRRTDNHGEWAPSTFYNKNDVFDFNGALYVVMVAHTSGATFDPNATDGMGHNLYALLLTAPGNVLPLGGLTGQILAKASNADLDVVWVTEYFVPPGGTTGQQLVKHSGANGDTMWVTPAATPSLEDLTDVATVSPKNTDDVLYWNGSAWSNAPVGNVYSTTLDALTDVQLTSPHVDKNVLYWNNGAGFWEEAQLSVIMTPADRRNSAVLNQSGSGTFSVDPTTGDVFTFISFNGTSTINATAAPAGARVVIIITTSGTTPYNITFGTNFKSVGVLNTGKVSGATFIVTFEGDGTNLNEVSRSPFYSVTTTALGTTGTVSIDPTLTETFTVVPTGNITLNAASAPVGRRMTIIVTTSGTSSFNITPNTNFKSTGALATGAVSGKVFTMTFVGDGTNMNEMARTAAM